MRRSSAPEGAFPHDLHVLGTPPAFVLSQDQTLRVNLARYDTSEFRLEVHRIELFGARSASPFPVEHSTQDWKYRSAVLSRFASNLAETARYSAFKDRVKPLEPVEGPIQEREVRGATRHPAKPGRGI